MSQPPSPADPFPPAEFDQWAGQYDADVVDEGFPFSGYSHVLAEVVRQAEAGPGMSLLDLGAGTGNLAARFASLGCELWCTDFSDEMLARAQAKLPAAHCVRHDLRRPFPAVLARRFERIVSAYVFHHFELPEKVDLVGRLVRDQLAPGGRLLIADISFPTWQALAEVRQAAGERWDDELYWVAAEALPALAQIDPHVAYVQVSDCAGVYRLSNAG